MISKMLYGFPLDSNHIKIPIVAYTDNKSLYKSAYSTTIVQEHRLRIDLAIIKEMLEKMELLKLLWVANGEQLADSCFLSCEENKRMIRNVRILVYLHVICIYTF